MVSKQMDYPNNFYTPVFPKSRKIALSRAVAVWSLIAFAVIAALCGLLLWAVHSTRQAPFLISINHATGEWKAVGEKTGPAPKVAGHAVMQESVVGNFAMRWFEISEAQRANEINWCKCERARCTRPLAEDFTQTGGHMCFLCCKSDDSLYKTFSEEILPGLQSRFAAGEIWYLAEESLVISPVSRLSENGGTWRVSGILESNASGPKHIEAYVRISRSVGDYPLTLGYYVSDFNGYVVE